MTESDPIVSQAGRPRDARDTSPDAFAVQLACLRNMSPAERIRRMCRMSRTVRKMAFDAIRRRHPRYDDHKVRRRFIELTYGTGLADVIGLTAQFPKAKSEAFPMSDTDDLVDALDPVLKAFRELGVRHFIGGSVASSFHGATRTTMDVDVVCELLEREIPRFVAMLGDVYYVSEPAIRDAVRRRSCFNLIHLPTSFKVDVFVSRRRPFDDEAMRRATPERLGDGRVVDVPIASAEDSIVSKLEWYRLTDETSERQWGDVARLLSLLGDQADVEYLRRAAASVGVDDLLGRLLRPNGETAS